MDLRNDYKSFCGTGSGSGPDAVYALLVHEPGTLHVTLAATDPLIGVLYARSTCQDPTSVLGCAQAMDGSASLTLAVSAGELVWLFVDGRDATAGPYSLHVKLDPAACGDGVVNAGDVDAGKIGEQCDPPGDGCSLSCQFEPPNPQYDKCPPGEAIVVSLGSPVHVPGLFTVGYTSDYDAPCNDAQPGAPDRVFRVTSLVTGTLAVDASGSFDLVLSAHASCKPALAGLLACSDATGPKGPESITVPVSFGDDRYIVIDGYEPKASGTFQVTFSLKTCTPGNDETCNEDPAMSGTAGTCKADGTCSCKAGFSNNPNNGKCG